VKENKDIFLAIPLESTVSISWKNMLLLCYQYLWSNPEYIIFDHIAEIALKIKDKTKRITIVYKENTGQAYCIAKRLTEYGCTDIEIYLYQQKIMNNGQYDIKFDYKANANKDFFHQNESFETQYNKHKSNKKFIKTNLQRYFWQYIIPLSILSIIIISNYEIISKIVKQ